MNTKHTTEVSMRVISNDGNKAILIASDGNTVTVEREEGTKQAWIAQWPVGSRSTALRQRASAKEFKAMQKECRDNRRKDL